MYTLIGLAIQLAVISVAVWIYAQSRARKGPRDAESRGAAISPGRAPIGLYIIFAGCVLALMGTALGHTTRATYSLLVLFAGGSVTLIGFIVYILQKGQRE